MKSNNKKNMSNEPSAGNGTKSHVRHRAAKKPKCQHTVSYFDHKKIKMVCVDCGYESDDF